MTTTDAQVRHETRVEGLALAYRLSMLEPDLPDCVAHCASVFGLNPPGEDARTFLESLVGLNVELILTVNGELRVMIRDAGTAAGGASLVDQANAKYFMEGDQYCVEDKFGFGVIAFDLADQDDFQALTDATGREMLLADIHQLEVDTLLGKDEYAELEDEALDEAVHYWLADDVLDRLVELHPDYPGFDSGKVADAIQQALDSADLPYEVDYDTVYVSERDLERFIQTLDPAELTEQ